MIHLLEKEVADKIAAGEVIDKPLSVVKELVENSIDAGATMITVEIKKGGKHYIRVTDNGCGIDADETELAFMRHATSKITRAADLESLETLGFRGEALASIAAVSRTEIITKTPEARMGVKLLIEGSCPLQTETIGCPDGTTIVVRDLFYNTPARKKFMNSDAAESSAIIEFLSHIALAYVNLRMRVINNGTMLFSTQGRGDRYRNILTVYSKEIGVNLIPFHAEQDYLKLDGYISGPGITRPNRKHQIFFVNGRIVDSQVIQQGISQAYADRLFEGRFPITFLFLQTRADTLEVNIHPNKRMVRFHDKHFVMEFIRDALREALLSREAIPSVNQEAFFKMPVTKKASDFEPVSGSACIRKEEQEDIKKLLLTLRKEADQKNDTMQEEKAVYTCTTEHSTISDSSGSSQKVHASEKTPPPFDFNELSIRGAVFGTYIIATDADNFYLIDQHAAHERVFFEHFMAQYKKEDKHRQHLMIPFTLDVSYSTAELREDWMKLLGQMGFSLEVFGPKTYIIKEIPLFMDMSEAKRFLSDFMDRPLEGDRPENTPAVETLIMRSCKSAVKAHDYLKDAEIQRLIEDLGQCENPFSCPHGRPTFIKITQHQIERMFKRT